MASNDQIPAIRISQFDGGGIGATTSSVNLFRGDVNYVHSLFSMPGRSTDQSMAVEVSLLYQSNVTLAGTTWNRDAPTSVVGLGWTLPLTYIELVDQGSPTPGRWNYTYWANGVATPLIAEPATPFLFSMPSDLATELTDGKPAPNDIRTAFGTRGIALGANALVSAPPTGSASWTLTDDDDQQLFSLVVGPSSLDAFDGGQSFQLQNYKFWKILYYAQYERWVVKTEAGQTLSFGGIGTPTPDRHYATAEGNSIAWGVRWTSDSGAALWSGPSALATNQQQYARSWYLARASNIWGDAIVYGYNEWARDATTELIPEVEQQVGSSSPDAKPYTKACYLTSITDVFGRKAVFNYEDKQWSNSSDASPREYADPHKATPDATPNAYQDCYETKYLDSVEVYGTGQTTLFAIKLSYELYNVNNYSGVLYGDTFKRYLTGIQLLNADGDALPAVTFQYYLGSTPDGASPGALESITYPEGGTATYTYTKHSLAVCDRSVTVSPPKAVGKGAVPRVWFGPDYAVTTWDQPSEGELSLVVYTWLGRWVAWQLGSGPLLFESESGFESLDVLISDDFFALCFETEDGQHEPEQQVYLFRKDVARPGQWVPASVDGNTTAPNTPTLIYDTSTTFQVGNNFLVAISWEPANSTGYYQSISWNWAKNTWEQQPKAELSAPVKIAAFAEYYLVLDANGNATVNYLDPSLNWQHSEQCNFAELAGDLNYVALVPGPSFVAVCREQDATPTETAYGLTIIQWGADYQLAQTFSQSYADKTASDGTYPSPWVPVVVGNQMVACAGHVLRFNGQNWLENSSLTDDNQSYQQLRYAYGPDYTLQIRMDAYSNATAAVLTFDPNADSAAWNSQPATPKTELTNPLHFVDTANWPSAGQGDYLTLGQYLYFRGTATDWADVVDNDPTADLQALVNPPGTDPRYIVNSQSLINQAGEFIGYAVYDTGNVGSSSADVVVLKNGQVLDNTVQALAGQKFAVASDYPNNLPPSGTFPGGPSMFASYPASADTFDDATEFQLNRFAGDDIEDNLVHYAVTGLTISDGFETAPTTYVPDPASAACDPTGLVIKYYRSGVYPGTDDATKPTYGYTVNTYLNGLDQDGNNDDNFYDMMDGLLETVTVYDSDNNQISQTTHDWQAYAQCTVHVSETETETETVNLYGAFVCPTSQTKVLDGVSSWTSTGYVPQGYAAPYSGLPTTKTSTTWGGDGKKETFTTTITYGCDLDDDVYRVLHILSKQLQSVTTWQPDGGDAVTIRAKATAYQLWPASALGSGVTVPAAEADFSWTGANPANFPFDSYTPGDQPSGWQRMDRILARTPHGLVCESEDGCGIARSVSFGEETFPVAQFINASFAGSECAYWGFEPYETNPGSGFTLTGCQPTTDDAHNGTTSLSLPNDGSASLAVSVTPQPAEQTYVLGYWSKTPTGFTASSGAGWTILLSFDGQQQPPTTMQFADTDGVWAYQTIGIPITPPVGTQSVTLVATATNTSGDMILLDDVFVAPLVSHLQARTFDPDYHLVTASMSASGRTKRTIYDGFQRVLASVGPDEQTMELNQRFLSRQGNGDGSFSSASPNAELTLHPAGGGIYEAFRGDEWATRWRASNQSTNWSVSDGSLQHSQTQSDTLSWIGWTGSTPSTAALFFDVASQGTLSDGFGITFGDGYQIGYSASGGYSFTDKNGNVVQAPLVTPPAMAGQWLLVLGCGVVLFFGDGQLVFSQGLSYGSPSTAITTGPNVLTFQYLAMLAEPRVGLSYTDAAARQRQVHQLLGQPGLSTSDARVCQIICDALNRKVATTRTAPASFGKDSGLPLLSYRPNFVDVDAFLSGIAANPASWTMAGDITDYYAGQKDGQIQRSNDEGYPYRGDRYEATPLNRVVEQGKPGKDLAIGSGNTVQFSYGAYSLGQGSSYYKHTTTGPIGTQAISITHTTGRPVAASLYDPSSDSTVGQTSGQVTYASDAVSGAICSLTIKLPNAFTTSPQTNPGNYVSTITQDPRGRMIARQDPSSGTTSYIYSPTGALRFVQPALDPGDTYFIYYRYDALGRIVEEGTLSQQWDPSTLMTNAAQPDWPDSNVAGKTVTRTYLYDGDGNDPTKIGKKIQALTNNPAPSTNTTAGDCTITETYAYDSRGHVTSTGTDMVLSGSSIQTGTIAYTYDNLGNVTSVTYPAGSSIDQVFYTHDDQGRVSGIGTSSGASDIASYTYTMDGDVETETRNGGKLAGVVNYTSPGWVSQIQTTSSGSTDACFEIDYTYNDDSTVQQRARIFSFNGSADTAAFTYQYDSQQRLTDAEAANGGSGDNESISQYDANGNIWQATQDDISLSYTCVPGNDQLQTASMADGSIAEFSYHADGWLATEKDATAGNSRAIERDIALALTRNITTTANGTASNARFAYGGGGQRTLKQVSGGTSLNRTYFYGNAQRPLALCDDGGLTSFIHGPTGLVAFVAPDKSQYVPLSDIQHTVWAVLDANNSPVAQFEYLPFGATTSSGTTSDILAYRFMGQEWDAETGLYNFRARLYDPELRRFISPDAAHQFASPYVFVGNDPLRMVDPSGNAAGWVPWAMGAVMVGVTLVGVGLTLFTGGASDVMAGEADAALVGATGASQADESLEGAPLLFAQYEEPEGAVAGEGAGNEVANSSSFAQKAASAFRTAKPYLIKAAPYAAGSLQGAGMQGLAYDVAQGRHITVAGFLENFAIGFASGALFAGIGKLGTWGSDLIGDALKGSNEEEVRAYSAWFKGAGYLTTGGIAGGTSSDLTRILTNLQQHQPWSHDLGATFGLGFAQGAISGVSMYGAQASKYINQTRAARILGGSGATVQGVSTIVDNIQSGNRTGRDSAMFAGNALGNLVGFGIALWFAG